MTEAKKTQGPGDIPQNSPKAGAKGSAMQQTPAAGVEDKSVSELVEEFTEMDMQEEQDELNEDESDDSSSESEEFTSEEEIESDGAAAEETEEELIRRTVRAANACQKRTDEDRFNVAMGIVNDFHGGDYKAASDKSPWKTNSLKKLRDDMQLEVKPRRLGDWIRAAGCRLGVLDRNEEIDLSFSNWLELIAIDDGDKRYELAVEVFENKLSVRHTRKRVLEINAKDVDPKLVAKLLAKIKDPRSLPVEKDYDKMDEEFLENELSKKERLLLRAEMDTKREQLKACSAFLDVLEKRLSDIDL